MAWLTENKERVSLGTLAVLTAGSALAVAGVPPAVLLTFGTAALVCGIAAAFLWGSRSSPAPVLALLFLAVFSALQAVPLPIRWLESLSPASADVWSRCLLPMGETVPRGSLSLDPGASLREALKWSAYAAVWHIASIASAKGRCERVLLVVFGSAVLVALASLGHVLAGATSVWGLYTPVHPVATTHWGPLLNSNTLAGYMNLGVLIGLGLLFQDPPVMPRSIIGLGVVIVAAVSIRAASRGGVVALAVGLLVFGIASYVRSRRKKPEAAQGKYVAILSGVVVLAAIGLALSSADDFFWQELLSENQVKLHVPRWVAPMIMDFRWFGVGRGAFESAFPAYRPTGDEHILFTHPENVVVQWLSEWGIVVGGLGMIGFCWLLRPTNLGFGRSSVMTGAWIGVAIVFLQNLVDLGTELFGVGIALAVTLGGIWGDARRRGTRYKRGRGRAAMVLLVGLCATPVFAVLVAVYGMQSVDRDRHTLKDLLLETPAADRRSLYQVIRADCLRHPGDHYFPMMGAVLARSLGDRPMPWLQRALERGPTVGRAHLLLAQTLSDYHLVDQTLLEARLAATYERALSRAAAPIAVALTRDPDRLMKAVPEGATGLDMLEALSMELREPSDLVAREQLDNEALRRSPGTMAPRARLVDARIAARASRAPPCDDPVRCSEELEAHANAFAQYAPNSTRAAMTRATVALWDERTEDADKLLAEGCKASDGRSACLKMHAEVVSSEPGSADRLDEILGALIGSSCTDHKQCAATHAWIAELRMKRKEPRQALTSLKKAAEEEPSVERWLRVAKSAEDQHMYGIAVEALQRAHSLDRGADPTIAPRIEKLRAQVWQSEP